MRTHTRPLSQTHSQTGRRMVAARGWAKGNGKSVFRRDGAPVPQDEKRSETDAEQQRRSCGSPCARRHPANGQVHVMRILPQLKKETCQLSHTRVNPLGSPTCRETDISDLVFIIPSQYSVLFCF